MKRLVLALPLLAAGIGGVFVYTGVTRDREYGRLIAEGDRALAADQTFLAIEAFSGAIALKGDSMLGYIKRGETYRGQGDLHSARRDLRAAVRLDPMAPRPLEQLGDVNYALLDYRQAAARYGEYVRLDDRTPRVLYKLALAHHRDGRTSAAIRPLRQAVGIDDRFAEAYYLLGLCLREQERSDEALEALRRAVELVPGLIPAREELVALHGSLGQTAEEIDQLEALAALDSNRPERDVSLGLAYARAGQTELAVLALGRAAEQHPDQNQVYIALGRVWLNIAESRGDRVALSKALEALQSIGGTTATSEALTLLGRALVLAGDIEFAERVLQQATERFPVDLAAYTYLANVAQGRGDFETAREALTKHLALIGDSGDATDRIAHATRIGDLSLHLQEPGVAVHWFERAADLSPPDAVLFGRLADARWRTGDVEGARAILTQGLEQYPQNLTLLELERWLQ